MSPVVVDIDGFTLARTRVSDSSLVGLTPDGALTR